MKNIVTISGGISSAWVAKWTKENVENPIFYFNDTKWEHPDLYRFLCDIQKALDIVIFEDTDGRNPEQVFDDVNFLANNRVPRCSEILKARRLQKFVERGDNAYFGIDCGELKRAARISAIYARLGVNCFFPIIDTNTKRSEMESWLDSIGVELPELYRKGFAHNNCAGGCVRAGVGQWKRLYEHYPDIYAERERTEKEFNTKRGTNYSFMKALSLTELREKIESNASLPFDDDTWHGECVGICGVMN